MCGRFKLEAISEAIKACFALTEVHEIAPRYNICPTQPVEVVRVRPEGQSRELRPVIWGLLPPWAKDIAISGKLMNARSETLTSKPTFRNAFRRRRCLIPTDGFYLWLQDTGGKQPYLIRLKSRELFAFAGLWEIWCGPNGEEIESCTIITTDANELVRRYHDRMPVIVHAGDYDLWLDRKVEDTALLQPLLSPYDAAQMDAVPVSKRLNSPTNDDRACIEPA